MTTFKIFDVATGVLLDVENIMGEVILWDLSQGGKEIARIKTPDFTGWGIIKGHYYTGGIYASHFAPDDKSLYLAGGKNQGNPKDKKKWGRIVNYEVTS